ncbi:tetratricopeptide repeat protein [Roseiflexus castenholzii]|uniref:Tetratricopeptide TPR_2 repeat protein n=2 Tax=Chloroflexota TaxID=200795 RepID=A7NHU4_ROSCS|nr:tetratricopeptide repeat protein [Roseiflexus castenholzii]ABU57041.1 Tetratricopeptide TPR_2 repeat protein [Roseiflexus castenholzii DSM 13941]
MKFHRIQFIQILLILAATLLAARLAFHPDPRDALRQADALFVAGRHYEAFHAYHALATRAPGFAPARLRLGMALTVRGESAAASREFGWALRLGLNEADTALARLYQGRLAADMGYADEASRMWMQIPTSSALYSLRLALEAEERLSQNDYAGAESGYRAALAVGLPDTWRRTAHARIAALIAGSDLSGAWNEARMAVTKEGRLHPIEQPLATPLRPLPRPDVAQIAAILASDEAIRPQLLGQIYLDVGWTRLAEEQFAIARERGSLTQAAEAYSAYAQLLNGDVGVALARLHDLALAAPDDPRPRILLALGRLAVHDAQAALTELQEARRLAPNDPDVLLALGEWHTAQRDYPAAAAAYAEALRVAPAAMRGAYALALAQYHLKTSLQICEKGLPAATEAVARLPKNAQSWSALAHARLACGDIAGARDAAALAQTLDPASAEAAYHYGRALAALGDRTAARTALIRAADLAPASEWRIRAEEQMAMWGMAP